MFIFADFGSGHEQKMGFFLYRRICGGELKGLFIGIDSVSNIEETDTVVGLFRSEEGTRLVIWWWFWGFGDGGYLAVVVETSHF